MKVEQCIIAKQPSGSFQITQRVLLACELVAPADDAFIHIRLLEAGAGLEAGDELTVPATCLRDV